MADIAPVEQHQEAGLLEQSAFDIMGRINTIFSLPDEDSRTKYLSQTITKLMNEYQARGISDRSQAWIKASGIITTASLALDNSQRDNPNTWEKGMQIVNERDHMQQGEVYRFAAGVLASTCPRPAPEK